MFKKSKKAALEVGHTNNIWNKHDFVMCGLGEKSRLWATMKHFGRCIKWSKQRIVGGYADSDIWNMYGYLQMLLPDMLEYLKNHPQMEELCKKLGLKMVPVEELGEVFPYDSVEKLLEKAKGKYASGMNKEGIVIRPVEPVYSRTIEGPLSMKVLNNDYLLKE